MPPRKKKEPSAPSTMKELKDTLWKAADKLRGSLSASQYKDVILGLVFLKYVSDAYEERRDAIRAELKAEDYDEEQIAELIDEPEEYQGYGVFVVPPVARWSYLAENAKGTLFAGNEHSKTIGQLVDEAMAAVMTENPTLQGTLPRLYNKDNIDQRRLGELIDLFNSARFSRQGEHKARDLMGEVYEYFLGKFARAEGKRGGEFFTPPSVVKVIVEVLEPDKGRVYDPCCGSGGMFVQTEKFIYDHDGDPKQVAIYGQESLEETWRMAKMNLAIHGINHNGLGSRWGDTFARDQHAEVQMDYVMANPPFNIKHWTRNENDPRWKYGVPPANNANYAWLQHIISKLKPNGAAGVVMANGSMSSNSNGEGAIRAQIVEADLVSCMVALPTQLFRSTGIPVCVWFFAKNKKAGDYAGVDRSGEVLFIDAREMGYMVDRAERALSDEEIVRIGDTYHAWRGTRSAAKKNLTYEDVPGFCKSVTLAEIKTADYALTPGRYVGAREVEDDGEPIDEKIARLTKELLSTFDESNRLEQVVREQLGRIA
ncbi:type I restriction-modification system subunit M [Saccharopolyspora indica]|uniref:class I SAM-dependent DNA methyltransferase n=1 Tax=Saccharopolyspora indica TaxID=1229659 RepID=UPI0022EB3597|nr:class I SAM-dependent DNA methyltransferase [Saccharopolyspora indica]MDA3649321.1 class I SAM-dependent DNA methyltransferase [Saccharopolyspora indica]